MGDEPDIQTETRETGFTPSRAEIGIRAMRALWLHRRRMAYISLCAALALTATVVCVALFATPHQVDNLSKFEAFLLTAFGFLTSLVGAYMGLATLADIRAGGNRFK